PTLDAIDIDAAVSQLKETLQGLERQTTRNRLVVKDLTRQTLMNRFQAEERQGDSGIVQVRYDKLGSRNYHHTTFIGNSFVAVHDHSDTIDTCGMGEFIGILNGVEFRTRHNDYRLVMPSRTSKAWHAYDEIPTPPVPQSVLDKPNLENSLGEEQKPQPPRQEWKLDIWRRRTEDKMGEALQGIHQQICPTDPTKYPPPTELININTNPPSRAEIAKGIKSLK
ncbi:hypothetical protein EGW08_022246, partial [Elysia chlorotica]